jgi:transcriptional regulator with XRE-family HTH domain
MRFGDKLQTLREKAGMSQSDLAKASGVPKTSIQTYEQHRREPLWSVLFKLCAGLGLSTEHFAECVEGLPHRIERQRGKRRTDKRKRPDR